MTDEKTPQTCHTILIFDHDNHDNDDNSEDEYEYEDKDNVKMMIA